jgi:hypothetical protein
VRRKRVSSRGGEGNDEVGLDCGGMEIFSGGLLVRLGLSVRAAQEIGRGRGNEECDDDDDARRDREQQGKQKNSGRGRESR